MADRDQNFDVAFSYRTDAGHEATFYVLVTAPINTRPSAIERLARRLASYDWRLKKAKVTGITYLPMPCVDRTN
jgi:hypothetical protein